VVTDYGLPITDYRIKEVNMQTTKSDRDRSGWITVALAGLALWLGVGRAFGAGPWCVSASGNGADGLAWATAFTNLQDAVNAASPGDSIYLAGNTFVATGAIQWSGKTLAVSGGYAGSGAVPGALGSTPTILTRSASVTDRIMTVDSVTNGVLERVTVTGGKRQTTPASQGGGLFVTNCTSLILSACTVTNNEVVNANDTDPTHGGGGIYVIASSVLVTNCLVANNRATAVSRVAQGAGIWLASGALTVQDTVIAHNRCSMQYPGVPRGFGGGVYVAGTAVLRNCLLYGNAAEAGISGSPPVPGQGDAAYVASGGSLQVLHSTVAHHVYSGLYRGAGTLVVSNSVVWANGDDIAGAVTLGYSNIEDGDSVGVNGNISSTPLFAGTYYLATNSPCVNAGSMDAATAGLSGKTTRTDGTPDSGTVDMGYHPPAGMDMTYADIYVAPAPAGHDGNSGTTAGNPFATIGKAISMAQDGTRIHLAAGNYTNNSEVFPLTLSNKIGLQLLGTNAALTVINAVGANKRVLTLSEMKGMRVEKVTLTGGNYNVASAVGGGIYLSFCPDVTFDSCIISGNTNGVGGGSGGYVYGGGIYMVNSVVTLAGCTVANNVNKGGNGYGGGIYMVSGTLDVRESIVSNNLTTAVYASQGAGGGLYMVGGALTMRNTLVHTNVVTGVTPLGGAGLYIDNGVVNLQNCTVVANAGQGVKHVAGTVTARNTILWGNGDDVVGTVTLRYSDIEDGDNNGVNGCTNANPLFVDAAAGNYRLRYAPVRSPCIDTGEYQSWMADAVDLDGNPRTKGVLVDMGAYQTIIRPSGTSVLIR
jgi:hypothetical protein